MILKTIRQLYRWITASSTHVYEGVPVLVLKKPTPGCEAVKLSQAVQWLSCHPNLSKYSTIQLWKKYDAFARQKKYAEAARQEELHISYSHFKRAVQQAKECHRGAGAPQITHAAIIPALKELEVKLFSKEVLCSLLPMLVSYDTAEVPVWIKGNADAPAKLVYLHVAGAISTKGCWLYTSELAAIRKAQKRDNYHAGHFLKVLRELQKAVRNGCMPVQRCSSKALAGLAAMLHSWTENNNNQQQQMEGAGAQVGKQQAACVQQDWKTRHYKCKTRGAKQVADIQQQLDEARATTKQLQPFVLLLDGASQHTCAAAVAALQISGQSAIQLVSKHNPIELLWDDLKKAAAQQQYNSTDHAMHVLVAMWGSMAGDAAIAMQQWRAPTK